MRPTKLALFFVHADHLNRPVAMSDSGRNWVWRAQYEPFGAVHSIVGPAANDNRFPGQLFQPEAGLAYNWHRHYDATLGRYTQPDPLGLQALLSDGPSVYGYVGQSPLMWIDEEGLAWRPKSKWATILEACYFVYAMATGQKPIKRPPPPPKPPITRPVPGDIKPKLPPFGDKRPPGGF